MRNIPINAETHCDLSLGDVVAVYHEKGENCATQPDVLLPGESIGCWEQVVGGFVIQIIGEYEYIIDVGDGVHKRVRPSESVKVVPVDELDDAHSVAMFSRLYPHLVTRNDDHETSIGPNTLIGEVDLPKPREAADSKPQQLIG